MQLAANDRLDPLHQAIAAIVKGILLPQDGGGLLLG